MPTPVDNAIQSFADLALKTRRQHIDDAYNEELANALATLSAKGMGRNSGAWETTELRLKAEKFQKLVIARASTLVEALQAYDAPVHEVDIMRQVHSFSTQSAAGMVSGYQGNAMQVAARTGRHDASLSAKVTSFQRDLERRRNAAETEARLLVKKAQLAKGKELVMTNQIHNEYHLTGPNSRVTIGGMDQSVNSVTVQPDELFSRLRSELMLAIPEGAEREQLLQKLTALQEAQGTGSFSERLGNFMAFAANWTTVITPFLPALAELARQVLT